MIHQAYITECFTSLELPHIRKRWDSAAIRQVHLHSTKLLAYERSKPEDVTFHYILIGEQNGERDIAIAYLQEIQFRNRNFRFGHKGILQWISVLILTFRSFRILICGNIFAVDFCAISSGNNFMNRRNLIREMSDFAKRRRADILVMKDLPEEFTREDFPDSGWKIFYPDLTMQMQIRKQWKDFEDYAADLRKNYRKRARKIRDSGRGLERKEITEAEFENLSSNIRNLFLQVAMRQTVRIGIIDENYFREMFRALGPDFRMRGYYHQDELIAFASYIYHPEKLEIHYIGINYSFNHTFNLYFNLLFDAVECSIKSGKRFLEMGRTARTAKAVTGGIPVRFNDFIWTGNRITALLLGVMTKYFQKKMGEDWKKRNPFINIDT